jgi:hypothetical protein
MRARWPEALWRGLWLALLVRPHEAFVLNGGAPNDTPARLPGGAYRWHVPALTSSFEGLGGGIGWVVDEGFCDGLIGRFPERDLIPGIVLPSVLQFVHCSDLRNALQRGFATWSDNHPLLSFTDLSTTAPCTASGSVTGALADSCPWELYVGTDDGSEHPSLAAYVVNHRTSSVDSSWFSRPLRSSAGEVVYGVDAHARSEMRFQTHLCWYLDATFCWYFQMLHEDHNVDVLLIVRVVLLALFGLAALRVAGVLFWCFVAACCLGKSKTSTLVVRQRGKCSSGCSACLDYLSSLSPGVNVLVLFLLIFPPVFYYRVFMPCWECYDFEAAVAHEAGHVLGFGHPDAVPEENIVGSCAISNATCRDPFGECASTRAYTTEDRSIMQMLTQHTPRTCLSTEDLQGLYFLYPLCDDNEPTDVACTKGRRLSGWLRLAIIGGVPFLLSALLVLLPLTCLRWRDQRRVRQLSKELGSAQGQILRYQQQLNSALRTTAREALSRPGTALMGAVRLPNPRGGRAQVHPAGGGGGVARAAAARLQQQQGKRPAAAGGMPASAAPAVVPVMAVVEGKPIQGHSKGHSTEEERGERRKRRDHGEHGRGGHSGHRRSGERRGHRHGSSGGQHHGQHRSSSKGTSGGHATREGRPQGQANAAKGGGRSRASERLTVEDM